MSDRYRLLLVDDIRLMRGIAKSYFNRSEFQTSTARGGEEALRMSFAIRPHLVIMDAEMPEMGGADCCRRIKNDPDLFTTPVILLTDDDPDRIDDCWNAGCDGLLVRPFGRRELLTAARQYVALANRAAPRIARNLLVSYKAADGEERHDFAHNLGPGGLFLVTEGRFAPDDEFVTEFLIPRAEEPTRCRSRVAWVNAADNPKRPDLPSGIGLEFIDLDREDRLRLQRFVLEAARAQLGQTGRM